MLIILVIFVYCLNLRLKFLKIVYEFFECLLVFGFRLIEWGINFCIGG